MTAPTPTPATDPKAEVRALIREELDSWYDRKVKEATPAPTRTNPPPAKKSTGFGDGLLNFLVGSREE